MWAAARLPATAAKRYRLKHAACGKLAERKRGKIEAYANKKCPCFPKGKRGHFSLSKKAMPSLTKGLALRFMPRLYAYGVQFDTQLREKCFPQRTCRCGKRLKLFFRCGEKTLRGFFDSLKCPCFPKGEQGHFWFSVLVSAQARFFSAGLRRFISRMDSSTRAMPRMFQKPSFSE